MSHHPPTAETRPFSRSRLAAETAAVARLAAPVATVQLGMMLMGTVDAMMLGRVSAVALASAALGNAVTVGLVVFPMGVLMGLDPLVAQAFGAGDHRRVRRYLRHGLLLAVLLSIPMSLVMWPLAAPLRWLGQPPEVAAGTAAYLRALIPGNVAFLAFVAVRHTLQAMSVVRPAFLAMVAANLINVGANYLLIFGHGGFPALGVVGSALATSFARWTLFLGLTAAGWPVLRRYLSARPVFSPRIFGTMFRLGAPIGVQLSAEIWLFVATAFVMGWFGAHQLAAHQIALTLASLAFMVPLGVSGAAATRVGNAVGRGAADDARRAAAVCLALGGGVMSVSAAAFALFPTTLARIFTDEAPVLAAAAALLPIAAALQVFDGLQVVANGCLRGTADTRGPAVIALVGYWLFALPLGIWLALGTGLGPAGPWWGLTIGLGTVAALLLLRIRRRFAGPLTAVADAGGRGRSRV